MRILVSCIPFDHGRSGISVYMRHTVAALAAAGHELTLVLEPEAVAEPAFSPHRKTMLLQGRLGVRCRRCRGSPRIRSGNQSGPEI